MITDKLRSRHERFKTIILNSDLPADDKGEALILLDEALENCNGRTLEERVQGLAETNLFMIGQSVCRIIDAPRETTWKSVLVKVKWQATIAIAVIATMLILRPELSALIQALVK